ncbi:hypothetical protein GII30_03800 [Gordonia amarae]|uniref:Integral membrane protein n=2 Tax=Gordonia amarae TaxID=36821 RepID=G7GU91_9ACTN|nr:hypothetical protein [Gordonia amarae]MCS3877488.1 hypothetical protein [Gordonia amarae]QHN16224.1 hypothetical protein GII35_03805 [Gordonia amarae]QHN20793.1 hypothetical protein GII34_03805 [Gordonia amarae]QHN29644.1 hypothetical protein GII32_03810 [Gordonia amarae]QHN38420.1 hypothetical protein GII30_03800 [Gordonia amarae]
MSTHTSGSRRLSRKARRGVLIVHIVSSVGWIGVNLAMLALAVTAVTSDSGATVSASIMAITVIVPPVVPALAAVTLASGVVLGLGTSWGVVTYWWVAVKLAISVILTVLVAVLLTPNALTIDVPDPVGTGGDVRGAVAVTDFLFPPVVSTVALLVATWLSVVKPGGKVGRGSKSGGRAHPVRRRDVRADSVA